MTNGEKFKEVFGEDFYDMEPFSLNDDIMFDRHIKEWIDKGYELPNTSFVEDNDKLNDHVLVKIYNDMINMAKVQKQQNMMILAMTALLEQKKIFTKEQYDVAVNKFKIEYSDKFNNIGKLEKELSDLKESLSLIRNEFQGGTGDNNG